MFDCLLFARRKQAFYDLYIKFLKKQNKYLVILYSKSFIFPILYS